MATDKRVFTMRMQSENFEKIKKIAEFNKRSIAMQIEFLVETCISEFENTHGRIIVDTEAYKIDFSGNRYNTPNLKLHLEPEGTLKYIFDNNDEVLQGSLKYTFGYYNATRNFLLLEQIEGDLISNVINSKNEIYYSCIMKLINTNLEIPYEQMSNRVDIFFNFQGEYKELEIGKKATKNRGYTEIVNALPRDNETISKWLKKPVAERKDFWRKEIERIYIQKDD